MIHKSRQALRHLNHVIDRQNRLLSVGSCKVLQTYQVSLSEQQIWSAALLTLVPVPLKINVMTFSKSHDIQVMTLVFHPTKQISWHSASNVMTLISWNWGVDIRLKVNFWWRWRKTITIHIVVPYSSNVCENSLVQWNVWIHRLPRENVSTMSPALGGCNFSSFDILLTFTLCQCNVMSLLNNLSGTEVWGGCGCEVSCGGHHRQRGKTTMGSALGRAVVDFISSTQYEQIPIIFGVWPFWLTPFFFRSITFWRVYG